MTVEGGHGLDDLESLALAGIVGVLGFLTWAWTDRSSRVGIARRADERLGLGGGLVAAYENASRPERPMAELGARRTLSRAPFARLRAATVPPFEVFLVLPLLGGVALFRSIESRDEAPPTGITMVSQVSAIAAGLQQTAAAHPGELDAAQLAQLDEAMGAAQAAAQDSAGAGMGDAMRDVAEALDDAAASLPEGSALGEKLERLAFEAETAAVDTAPSLGGDSEEEPSGTDVLDPSQELAAIPDDDGGGPGTDSGADSADESGVEGAGSGDTPEGPGVGDDASAQEGAGTSGPQEGEGDGALSPELPGSETPGAAVKDGALPAPEAAPAPDALDPTSAAPAPWWPDKDDDLVRAWLARDR